MSPSDQRERGERQTHEPVARGRGHDPDSEAETPVEAILNRAVGDILVMARHKKPIVVLKVNQKSALSTLADNTVTTQNLISGFTTAFWVVSTDLTWSRLGGTSGEVPLDTGITHGSYTVAQVLEALDASPDGPDDLIAIEQGRRKIRAAGTFGLASTDEVMNDGKPIRTKCNFAVGIGSDLDAYLVNRSGGALTTGGLWKVSGKIYGRWM